jgi:cellulose synthase/poly-beta-1,6-N-acetylglucosamine synthase-like glycosyltransferase
MAATSGEIIFFTDVRQTLHSESLEALVSCFADPRVGAACGELFIQSGTTVEEANVGLYWRYEKWIRRQLDRVGTLLVVTGCIYALRRSLARPIPPDTLGDDAFLPSNVILEGYRIVFEPRARAYDFPTSLDTEFGRKVRTLAGLYQLVQRMPRIALPVNPMWLQFFSYKLGRLLMPYALIVMAVASFALPSPWNALALAAQGAFYGVALADRWIPDYFRLKRLTAPVRTFVVLMAASLCAASVLFVPPGRLWKTTRVQPAGSA